MKKKLIIISSILFLVLASVLSILLITNKSTDEIVPNFSYVETEKYELEELIDIEKSNIDLNDEDINNFKESNMLITNVTYGNNPGLSTTLIDPLNFEIIHNLSNTSLLVPYYKNHKLDSLISGSAKEDETDGIMQWEKTEKHFAEYDEMNYYDHEMFKYKSKDYILDSTRIWISDPITGEETKFSFTADDDIGLPPLKDLNGNRIASPAGYHFNSFDIYGENILLNSRDYGVIFSVNILNEDGTLKDEEDYKLNWVLSGNSITPWYIDSNFEQDGNSETWENPITFNGGTNDVNYYNFDENPNYDPKVFNEWEGKLLKVDINGTLYDFEDVEQAKQFNLLDNDYKFWGAHTVRVVNKYLDSVSETISGYDPTKLYVSIHDNHFPSDVVYKFLDTEMHGVNWGNDPYSYHAYTDKTKSIFGDNPYQFSDMKSFTKIYEIDEETMIAKEVFNRDNTISEEINQFSDYRSSSTFFSINGQSYLATESSLNSSFALVAFDGIDFETMSLINERTLMDVQWTGIASGYMHYRTYPIFGDVTNVAYGWNALNEDPYMG